MSSETTENVPTMFGPLDEEGKPKTPKKRYKQYKKVLYVYIPNDHKVFITHLAARYNMSASKVIETLVSAYKENKVAEFVVQEVKFLERAEQFKKRKRRSLRKRF